MPPYSVEAWPSAEERPSAAAPARAAKRLVVPVIAVVLLAVVAVSGVVIYQNWQHAAAVSQLRAALARHDRALAREQSDASQVRTALTRVGAAHARLNSAMNTVISGSQQCPTVSCFDTTAATAATASGAFLRTIQGISFPAGAASAVTTLEKGAAANQRAWMSMTHATSFADYGDRATRAEKSGQAFDSGYSALAKSLAQAGTVLSERAAVLNRESAALRRRGAELRVPVNLRRLPGPSVQSVA